VPRRLAGGAAGRVGVGACASDLYETRERCVSDLYRGVGADEGEMCARFVPGSWGGRGRDVRPICTGELGRGRDVRPICTGELGRGSGRGGVAQGRRAARAVARVQRHQALPVLRRAGEL